MKMRNCSVLAWRDLNKLQALTLKIQVRSQARIFAKKMKPLCYMSFLDEHHVWCRLLGCTLDSYVSFKEKITYK